MTDTPKPDFGAPASFTNLAFDSGVIWMRERVIKMLSDRICFDHKAGSCDHRECYGNAEMVERLQKEAK